MLANFSIKIFIILLVIMLTIDFLWIGVIAKGFYKKQLGSQMKSLNAKGLIPVILIYLIMAFALVFFVGNYTNLPCWQTFLVGALLGFTIYAVYDLTNLATLKFWNLKMVIVDVLWGTVLMGISALILRLLQMKI